MSQILDFVKLMDLLAETIERARQKIPNLAKNMGGAEKVIEFLVLTNAFFKTWLIKT